MTPTPNTAKSTPTFVSRPTFNAAPPHTVPHTFMRPMNIVHVQVKNGSEAYSSNVIPNLDRHAQPSVPSLRHLLAQEADRRSSSDAKAQCDEEPGDKERAEVDFVEVLDNEHDRKSASSGGASVREDVPVLHAASRVEIDEEEWKRAESAEGHEVPSGERRPVEYDGSIRRDHCLPGAYHEEAGQGHPRHGEDEGPCAPGDAIYVLDRRGFFIGR